MHTVPIDTIATPGESVRAIERAGNSTALQGELILMDQGQEGALSRIATGDSYVVQPNELARSRYTQAANLHAHRILAVAIAKVDRKTTGNHEITIGRDEMRAIFDSYKSTGDLTRNLVDACDRLMATRAESWSADKTEWKAISLIITSRYNTKTKEMKITLHPEAADLLLRVQTNFTRYQLKQIAQFQNEYQHHLYQFLRSHAYLGTVLIAYSDLRHLFALEEGEYTNPCDLRRRVLEPTVRKINACTDINVVYEMRRRGRTYGSVSFRISQKQANRDEIDEYARAATQMLVDLKFDPKRAREIVLGRGAGVALRAIAYTQFRVATSLDEPIKDTGRYLSKLLATDVTITREIEQDYRPYWNQVNDQYRYSVFMLMPEDTQAQLKEAFCKTLEPAEQQLMQRLGSAETPTLKRKFVLFLRDYIDLEKAGVRLN